MKWQKVAKWVGISVVLAASLSGCKGNAGPVESQTPVVTSTPEVTSEPIQTPAEKEQSDKQVQIAESKVSLEGLNEIENCEFDVDGDGKEEAVKVYCAAEKDESGNLLLDDGQDWAVVVEKDGAFYPLFERAYIQHGQVQTKVYQDEQGKAHIMLIAEDVASLKTIDYIYDQETKGYVGRILLQEDNINPIN